MSLNNLKSEWWFKDLEPLATNSLKLIPFPSLEVILLDPWINLLFSLLLMVLQLRKWKLSSITKVRDQETLSPSQLMLKPWETIFKMYIVHQLVMSMPIFLIRIKEIFWNMLLKKISKLYKLELQLKKSMKNHLPDSVEIKLSLTFLETSSPTTKDLVFKGWIQPLQPLKNLLKLLPNQE